VLPPRETGVRRAEESSNIVIRAVPSPERTVEDAGITARGSGRGVSTIAGGIVGIAISDTPSVEERGYSQVGGIVGSARLADTAAVDVSEESDSSDRRVIRN